MLLKPNFPSLLNLWVIINIAGVFCIIYCGHMLISLSFTTAESVVISFNQKTQYDSIWQGLFSHFNAAVGAKDAFTFC